MPQPPRQADVWSTLAGRMSVDWSRVYVSWPGCGQRQKATMGNEMRLSQWKFVYADAIASPKISLQYIGHGQGLGKSPILEDGHQSMRNGITYETSGTDDVCIPILGLMIIPDIVICAMVKNNCIPILGDGPEWSSTH